MHKHFNRKEWSFLCEAWSKAMLLEGVKDLRLGISLSDVFLDFPDVLDWAGIDRFTVDFSMSEVTKIEDLWRMSLYNNLRKYSDKLEDDRQEEEDRKREEKKRRQEEEEQERREHERNLDEDKRIREKEAKEAYNKHCIIEAKKKRENDERNIEYIIQKEVEWEYAARGGHKSKGIYKYSGSQKAKDVAWHNCRRPHKVKTKLPNELGVYDMSGNIAEWCEDDFDGKYELSKGGKALRGGWYELSDYYCRVSYRNAELPNNGYRSDGFRLVLSW